MKKSLSILLLTSYLFAGSYENGLEFYKKAQYKKAFDSFKIATNNLDNKAMLALSTMYANGDGVDKNLEKSIFWLKRSADLGNLIAAHRLGEYYASKQNFKDAFIWFEKAAIGGDSKAQYNLGYFYTGGLGVDRDLKKSLQWYEKAATAGNIDAQLNLGFMYIGGHGTKVDYKKAAFWINKAKQTGSSKAQVMWDEFKLGDYK